MKTFILAFAVATAAFAAPAVNAQTAPTAKVFYGDLNLDGAAGQAALKVRLTRAAHTVCGNSGQVTLVERANVAACFAKAMHDAMAQVPATEQIASR